MNNVKTKLLSILAFALTIAVIVSAVSCSSDGDGDDDPFSPGDDSSSTSSGSTSTSSSASSSSAAGSPLCGMSAYEGSAGAVTEAFWDDVRFPAAQCHLYHWNGIASQTVPADPFHGVDAMTFTVVTGDWNGWALQTDITIDMSMYDTLHLTVRSSTTADLTISCGGGAADAMATTYGYIQGGGWCSLDIPLSAFSIANLAVMDTFIVITGATEGSSYDVDEVYFSGP